MAIRDMLKRISWQEITALVVGFVLVSCGAWALGLFTLSQFGKGLNWIAPALTAFATIAIAAFTWTLWRATDKLREAGERQAELTRILEHAYLSAKPLGINPYVSERGNVPDRIVGHVAFVNVGRLPARNVSVDRAYIKWSSNEFLPETDLPVDPVPPMTVVLPPGTEMRHGSDDIPASELDKPGYLYVWGSLEYTDGFGTSRYTQFRHRYPCLPHKSTNEGKSVGLELARYHQYGNDAD
jgi:hypothetical protein